MIVDDTRHAAVDDLPPRLQRVLGVRTHEPRIDSHGARGIVANRMRSALTMLGILIGVGSVIILVAVGAGSAAATRQSLEALGSNTLTVSAGGFGQGNRGGTQSRNLQITDADVIALSDKLQAPDIAAVVPTINGGNSITAAADGASATVGQFLGTSDAYSDVRHAPVQAGTFFTAADVEQPRQRRGDRNHRRQESARCNR